MKKITLALTTVAFAITNVSFAESALPLTAEFNGVFFGANAGFINLIEKTTVSQTFSADNSFRSDERKFNASSGYFDGQLGYGRMISDEFYLAGKFAITYTPFEHQNQRSWSRGTAPLPVDTGNSNFTTDLRPIYSIDMELGYLFDPTWISYLVGGVNFANTKHTHTFNGTHTVGATLETASVTADTNTYKTGFNIGIGIKHLIAEHWLLAAEYEYIYLGKTSDTATISYPTSSHTVTEKAAYKSQAISGLASVSYLFNC